MIFNSATFLIFFVLFFFLYWWINRRFGTSARNAFTILASYIFYGWWDWRFLGLIVASSACDYLVGRGLEKAVQKGRRKLLLLISLAVNLGILAFFKYFNFFVDSFSQLFTLFGIHLHPSTLSIILPVGISFYTFQTLSYTIDVYRARIRATRDPIAFFAFVAFFPQLVAGPIERAGNLLGQFAEKKSFSYEAAVAGLRLVLWGLFKKIVIADNFGVLADQVFATQSSLSGLSVFAGTLFFALQIYADFSGYSDIAIGLARMMGFRLMTNFRTPYFSSSFREFWQRWHISLSTWFRDYLYIPLGGSRKGKLRTYANLFITFVLSGLWHGANLTFLIWGTLHALMLMLEKRFRLFRISYAYPPLVLLITILLWLPFRANDVGQLNMMCHALADFNTWSADQLMQLIGAYSPLRFIALCMVLALFLTAEWSMRMQDFNQWVAAKKRIYRYAIYYALLIGILLTGNFSVKPDFIYFQF